MVFQKFDKTTTTVLCFLALMAVLLIGFMIHIVDRSSEQIKEIKETKVVLGTGVAPVITSPDDLVNLIVKEDPHHATCIVSDGKITPAILHKILEIKNLREVFLKRCEFTLQDIQTLAGCPLVVVRIDEGEIDENCVQVIARMPKLALLDIFATDVPPHAFAHLANSNVSWLLVHYCLSTKNGGHFTAADLGALCDMKDLRCLELERDKFAPGALSGLCKSKVIALNVDHCSLSDSDVADIAKIPNIQFVNLNRNENVTCKGLKSLLGCKTFKAAAFDGDLSKCDLTAEEKKKFGPKMFAVPASIYKGLNLPY